MTGNIEFANAPFYAKFIPPVCETGKSEKTGKTGKSAKCGKSVKAE